MKMPVIENGRVRNAEDVSFADLVINTKNNKGMWPTIELLLQYWMSKKPEDVKAFKIQVQDTRSDLRDKKFGQTRDKNMERRLTIVFPEALHNLIRVVYPASEMKMDREFFNEFARRFPAFRIPDHL